MEGIITNIQRFSTGDGPGIRTTVFIKGCPLRCLWCQNPETWTKKPQIAWYKSRCIECGKCIEICPNDAITGKETLVPDEESCEACGKCVEVCPKGAREIIGEKMDSSEVLEEITKDRVFYEESGGGVTISGGEALVQPEFTRDILQKCREKDISTALDTSGYYKFEKVEAVLPFTDLVLYDLKHLNPDKHRKITGVGPEKIMENIKKIDRSGTRIWIRTPIVPGYTDSEENIKKIAEFIANNLENVERYDLLPYNPLVESDYENINKNFPLKGLEEPDEEKMKKLRKIAKYSGLKKVTAKG